MAKKYFQIALISTIGIAALYFLLKLISTWIFESSQAQTNFTLISTFVGIFVIAYYGMKGGF
jgi:hypothetical protein